MKWNLIFFINYQYKAKWDKVMSEMAYQWKSMKANE